jgi:aminoglycoside 6-adenylyltransferase
MRSEAEIMDMVIAAAREDDNVLAVLLNGSRANPNAKKDMFQDYDIVFIVRDTSPFFINHSYMDRFGDLIMLQMPETMRDPIGDGRFTYLALFNDLNRIDLQIIPADRYEGMLGNDSQTMLLLDKDNIVPAPPPASDASYHVKRPAANDFYSCCNNFWWCLQNVAKGIWRDELPYAMQTYERYVRAELDCMVEWQIGMLNGFQVSAGKMGKYFKRYLDADTYQTYTDTYSDGQYDRMWDSMFTMCSLFRTLASRVAENFDFCYPKEDDERMTWYLRHVRSLCGNGEDRP